VPNLGALLKEEFVRLSRREIRKQTAGLQKTSASYRRDIAAAKRRLAVLERAFKQAEKTIARATPASASAPAAAQMRFVAKGFKSLRQRLGLSAAQIGKLLGVSEQSIYNWESKKATPRRSQLPAIAELRGLGKREAMSRLSASASKKTKRKKTKR
jgi:DNA-binding transcriptional regulator YiaG